ncbi:MAG: chorismate synthase [Bdellovibrionales bacterium]|nr:chorismate synthase [Bdellovibrionales bacterium]
MSANSFGNILKTTSFGESHGKALGVVIDGVPAGLTVNMDLLASNLKRRRPGSSKIVSARDEADIPEILSGVFEGKTLGTPISVVVYNKDTKSEDYADIKSSPRPGHADDVWKNKFEHSDHRGGGRSSGRETLSRVISGSFAQMILSALQPESSVFVFSEQISTFSLSAHLPEVLKTLSTMNQKQGQDWIDSFPAKFPHTDKAKEIEDLLLTAKEQGKSYGGQLVIYITNPPKNLGQPVFHKLKADLASAYLGIGATSSFEVGIGNAPLQEGSQFHENLSSEKYGGIRGGISTGENMIFRLGFKPTSSVMDVAKKGRHDPCILPRAAIVVEAMTNLVLADHLLWSRLDKI